MPRNHPYRRPVYYNHHNPREYFRKVALRAQIENIDVRLRAMRGLPRDIKEKILKDLKLLPLPPWADQHRAEVLAAYYRRDEL